MLTEWWEGTPYYIRYSILTILDYILDYTVLYYTTLHYSIPYYTIPYSTLNRIQLPINLTRELQILSTLRQTDKLPNFEDPLIPKA